QGSTDGGKNWSVEYDLTYHRRADAGREGDLSAVIFGCVSLGGCSSGKCDDPGRNRDKSSDEEGRSSGGIRALPGPRGAIGPEARFQGIFARRTEGRRFHDRARFRL